MIIQETRSALSIAEATKDPARFLSDQKMGYIVAAREAVLARVCSVSPDCAQIVEELIDEHYLRSSSPPLGELWPWVLADLAGVDDAQVQRISQAWVAVYLYTLLLDRQCDEVRNSNATEVLTGTVLFEIGLGDLVEITSNTCWAAHVRSAVRDSIRSQLGDLLYKGPEASMIDKKRHAAGKNSGFLICVAAIAAVGGTEPDTLRSFTSNVLLALQHLDDIGDFEADYQRGHFTPLLSSAPPLTQVVADHDPRLSRFQVLKALIESQALYTILLESSDLLRQGCETISGVYGESMNTVGGYYMRGLNEAVRLALNEVQIADLRLKAANTQEEVEEILVDVERQLIVVAQQS